MNMKIKKKEQNQPQHIQNSIDQSYTANLLTIKHPASSIQKNASLNWQANINIKLLKITNCHVSGISGSRHLEHQKLANTQLQYLDNERGLQSCQSSGKLASEQYPFTLMSGKLRQIHIGSNSAATEQQHNFNGDFSNCQTLAAASNRQQRWHELYGELLAAFPSSLDHKMLDLAAFVQSWRILGELCKKT
ncbi:hypothetical protein ACLKA6_000668 [Drosophila palustris]